MLRGIAAVLDAALIGRAPGITGSVGGILQSKRGRGESNRDRSALDDEAGGLRPEVNR